MKWSVLAGALLLAPCATLAEEVEQVEVAVLTSTPPSAETPITWVRPWNVNNVVCTPEAARSIETAASVLADSNAFRHIEDAQERKEAFEERSADNGVVTSIAITDALNANTCREAF